MTLATSILLSSTVFSEETSTTENGPAASTCTAASADLSSSRIIEGDAVTADGVRFRVDGIDPDGTVHDALPNVSWTLSGRHKILADVHVQATLHFSGGHVRNIVDWIEVDESDTKLVLRQERKAEFIEAIREAHYATLVLSMSTEDYSDVYAYSEDLVFAQTCEQKE